jgi:hypothetical protein
MPVTLPPQEAEIRRMLVWSQPWQIVCMTLSWKTHQKKDWWSGSWCRPWVQILVPQKNREKNGRKEGKKWKEINSLVLNNAVSFRYLISIFLVHCAHISWALQLCLTPYHLDPTPLHRVPTSVPMCRTQEGTLDMFDDHYRRSPWRWSLSSNAISFEKPFSKEKFHGQWISNV